MRISGDLEQFNMRKEEIWKDVPQHEGRYQVSDLGRVRSLRWSKETILKKRVNTKGYISAVIYKDSNTRKEFQVHQLVMMAFKGHVPCGMKLVVDHIDNDKKNNRLDNLQIITNRENSSKDRQGGSSQYVGVNFRKDTKKWSAQITIENKVVRLGCYENEIDAHNAYQNKLKSIIK